MTLKYILKKDISPISKKGGTMLIKSKNLIDPCPQRLTIVEWVYGKKTWSNRYTFEIFERSFIPSQFGNVYFEGFSKSHMATPGYSWSDEWIGIEFAAEIESKSLIDALDKAKCDEKKYTFLYTLGEVNVRRILDGEVSLRIASNIRDTAHARLLLKEFLDDMYNNFM